MKLNFDGSKYAYGCDSLRIGSIVLRDGYQELSAEESTELNAHPAFEDLKALSAIVVVEEPAPEPKATKK